MTTRKIRPSRKTRHLLPFAANTQAARSLRPTEHQLVPMPPAPPAADAASITIDSEVIYKPAGGDAPRRRHQSLANLELERRTKRQTRHLVGRGDL